MGQELVPVTLAILDSSVMSLLTIVSILTAVEMDSVGILLTALDVTVPLASLVTFVTSLIIVKE